MESETGPANRISAARRRARLPFLPNDALICRVKPQLKCPKCGSLIYSRRHPVCGRCGEKLPESLMFSPVVRKKVDEIVEQDRKREEWGNKFPGHDTGSAGIIH